MNTDTIESSIDHLLGMLAARQPAPPTATIAESQLAASFAALQTTTDESMLANAEGTIWRLWCSHENAVAEHLMQEALKMFSRQDYPQAEGILGELVGRFPDWSEAWNKRATVRYLAGQDLDSLRDIIHTLELEPRHFGAVCGMGQICLRQNDDHSAMMAFQVALEINPNLGGLRNAIETLQSKHGRQLH